MHQRQPPLALHFQQGNTCANTPPLPRPTHPPTYLVQEDDCGVAQEGNGNRQLAALTTRQLRRETP